MAGSSVYKLPPPLGGGSSGKLDGALAQYLKIIIPYGFSPNVLKHNRDD
jgi:hypothetical protein